MWVLPCGKTPHRRGTATLRHCKEIMLAVQTDVVCCHDWAVSPGRQAAAAAAASAEKIQQGTGPRKEHLDSLGWYDVSNRARLLVSR